MSLTDSIVSARLKPAQQLDWQDAQVHSKSSTLSAGAQQKKHFEHAARYIPVRGEGIRSSISLSELLLSDRPTPIARALAYASRNACSGV